MRALTAADRTPEVGDVLTIGGKCRREVIGVSKSWIDFCDQSVARQHWAAIEYRKRADGGSITTDDEKER